MLGKPPFAAVAIFLALMAGCARPDPVREAVPDPEKSVTARIFSQLDRADYKVVYDEASSTFREGPGGFGGFANAMDQNRHKLGRCEAPTKRGSLRTIPTPEGLASVQDYERICANGVADIEVSTVRRQGRSTLLGLHFTSSALEKPDPWDTRPEWVSEDDLALLKTLEIDPQADLETRAAYHWRWRASHQLKAGAFVCPPGSAVDVSRTIKVVIAAEGKTCRNVDGRETSMLKLDADGSTTPLGDGR